MRRRMTGTLVGTLIIATALTASGPVAGSMVSPARKVLTPLQKGRAFYVGKNITFIAPSTPGAGFELTARYIAPFLDSYLHASVNVVDMGNGQGYPGSDLMAASTPDGLTIGEINELSDVSALESGQLGLNFNPAREEFISSTPAVPEVLVAAPSSPYTSFTALKDSSSAVPITVLPSSATNTEIRTFFGLLKVNAQYVTGYANAAALVTGFQRGDAPTTYFSLGNLGPLMAAGKARALAITVRPTVGTNYRQFAAGVPTFTQLLNKYPPKSKKQQTDASVLEKLLTDVAGNSTIVTQTKVAAYKLEALRAAVAWAFKQKVFQTEMVSAGLNPKYIDPVAAKAEYITVEKEGAFLGCYITSTC